MSKQSLLLQPMVDNIYKTKKSVIEHQTFFHTTKIKIEYAEYRIVYKNKDHRCWRKKGKTKCIDLFSCRTETTPRKVIYMDYTGQIYKDNFTIKEEDPNGKRKDILEKIVYEEPECNITVTNNTKIF